MPFNLDAYLGVHADALKIRSQRTEVLARNLANADTPGYQARDLDFESFFVRQGRTNLLTGHIRSGCSALRLPRAYLVSLCAFDAVDMRADDLLRMKIQLQLFAQRKLQQPWLFLL